MPVERTTQILPFKIIGVDYAGPLLCKTKGPKELYMLNSYQISLHSSLKWLIARKGRATVIYSNNVKTFVAASMWIGKINKDKKMQEDLIKEQKKMEI